MTESGLVGAWDAGPFDNDDAADFATELDDADPNQRIVLLREALQAGLDDTDEESLDEAFPRAVAAAAVVAASRVDAIADSGYAPKFLAADEEFTVPDDLVELAVAALDRLADTDNEHAEFFGEAGTLDSLRTALTT